MLNHDCIYCSVEIQGFIAKVDTFLIALTRRLRGSILKGRENVGHGEGGREKRRRIRGQSVRVASRNRRSVRSPSPLPSDVGHYQDLLGMRQSRGGGGRAWRV